MIFPRCARLSAILCVAASLFACDTAARNDPASIDIRPDFAVRYATERISPVVVQLTVTTEDFDGGQSQTHRSLGSGVIIDKEGRILTNFHVAGRAKRIEITLANQEHVRATVLGTDHWTDLTLVQLDMDEIHRKGLTFQVATLGDSSEVTLGQPVMAVGTPYGLARTVTSGIVSNTDRFIDEGDIDGYETGWFNNWIQTDAAINPGNSGGPLINLRGEVIGINTRGINLGNSLGFAIPINTAKAVIKELLANKKVTRSYIGVQLQSLQDLEGFYNLEANHGVLIASVEKGSPAEGAGIMPTDILLDVNGKPVNARFPEQLAAVRKLISDFPVGSSLELTIRRTGHTGSATVAATSTPKPAETSRSESQIVHVATEKLESANAEERALAPWGLTVRNLTRAYLREHHLTPVEGVLVTGAKVGSRAAKAGMQYGDIILTVGDTSVTNADELDAAVKEWAKKPVQISVDIKRDRALIPVVVAP